MSKTIKLRKGLNLNLEGTAEKRIDKLSVSQTVSIVPDDFIGVVPKLVVKEGEKVKAGDALFVNKRAPEVTFASPVSGTVKAIVRGERRKVLAVTVEADKETEYKSFEVKDIKATSSDEAVALLKSAGLLGYINQLPYAVSTTDEQMPRSIYVSSLRDMPLSGDFEIELEGNEESFQKGLSLLSRIAPVFLGIGAGQIASALTNAADVDVTVFDGPCPAGNVGVQINNTQPVNKGEVVWTVDPTVVIFIGRLVLTGKVDLRRVVALAGSKIVAPHYVEAVVGQDLSEVITKELKDGDIRLINGNPLTGKPMSVAEARVGAHTSEVTAIAEVEQKDEMFGWILPRFSQFSANRSYFSWLMPKKSYSIDARIKGGERHMIMSGEYDKVLPMDIYGEYLIKAIIAQDIDKMEQLGIYEVSPEDFALAEFVDSSKLELQHIVRQGLDMLRKENA